MMNIELLDVPSRRMGLCLLKLNKSSRTNLGTSRLLSSPASDIYSLAAQEFYKLNYGTITLSLLTFALE